MLIVLCLWLAAPEREAALFAQGKAALEAGDHETAAAAFGEAARRGGGTEAALLSAESFLEMKDPDGAERALESASGEGGGEAAGRISELRGVALVMKGREEEARPHLERALAAGRSGAAHHLGLARFHRAEYGEAVRLLETVLRFQPEDYYSLLYRAWALLEMNRLDEARRALEETRAVAATPEVEEMQGRLELRAERFEKALSHFQAALAANPRYAEAQFGLQAALRRLGRLEEAKAASAAFRKLHLAEQEDLRKGYLLSQRQLAAPADPGAAEELARHHLSTGDLQGAERYAWRALSLDQGRLSARLLLARALAGSGRYRNAAFHYQKILRHQADHREARAELEELVRRHARKRL